MSLFFQWTNNTYNLQTPIFQRKITKTTAHRVLCHVLLGTKTHLHTGPRCSCLHRHERQTSSWHDCSYMLLVFSFSSVFFFFRHVAPMSKTRLSRQNKQMSFILQVLLEAVAVHLGCSGNHNLPQLLQICHCSQGKDMGCGQSQLQCTDIVGHRSVQQIGHDENWQQFSPSECHQKITVGDSVSGERQWRKPCEDLPPWFGPPMKHHIRRQGTIGMRHGLDATWSKVLTSNNCQSASHLLSPVQWWPEETRSKAFLEGKIHQIPPPALPPRRGSCNAFASWLTKQTCTRVRWTRVLGSVPEFLSSVWPLPSVWLSSHSTLFWRKPPGPDCLRSDSSNMDVNRGHDTDTSSSPLIGCFFGTRWWHTFTRNQGSLNTLNGASPKGGYKSHAWWKEGEVLEKELTAWTRPPALHWEEQHRSTTPSLNIKETPCSSSWSWNENHLLPRLVDAHVQARRAHTGL